MGRECVYFIRSCQTGLIKIGFTTNLIQRFKHMQAHSGDKLDLMVHVADGRQFERELHRAYRGSRAYGEWYYPTDEVLCAIDYFFTQMGPEKLHAYQCYKGAVFDTWRAEFGLIRSRGESAAP